MPSQWHSVEVSLHAELIKIYLLCYEYKKFFLAIIYNIYLTSVKATCAVLYNN